ncbi:MAG: endonuclease/exonuclease/phosphatase family protein [Opitutaceae bacterium]
MKMLLPTLIAATLGAQDVPERIGSDLCVLTLNVRVDVPSDAPHTWEARRPLIRDFLQALKPDLVGLQEALDHQLQDLLADNPEFGAVGVGREDGQSRGEFSAILYRKDRLRPTAGDTFWLSATPEIPGSRTWGNHYTRVCTWARFTSPDGSHPLYLFNTHLDHESQEAREKSAALILERMASREDSASPVVLTGDFNAGESNPAILRLQRALTETFRLVHPDAVDVGTFHAFSDRIQPDKIDFIFVSPEIRVRSATIHRPRPDGRYLTDHEPVSAVIRLP